MTKIDVQRNQFNLIKFIKEVQNESGLVAWPSKSKTIRLTSIVITVTLIVGVYLGVIDSLLTLLVGKIL